MLRTLFIFFPTQTYENYCLEGFDASANQLRHAGTTPLIILTIKRKYATTIFRNAPIFQILNLCEAFWNTNQGTQEEVMMKQCQPFSNQDEHVTIPYVQKSSVYWDMIVHFKF